MLSPVDFVTLPRFHPRKDGENHMDFARYLHVALVRSPLCQSERNARETSTRKVYFSMLSNMPVVRKSKMEHSAIRLAVMPRVN